MRIIPVILCGGKGSRLWPLSNPQSPKHLLRLGSDLTLFQQTLLRCSGTIYDPKPIVVTSISHHEEIEYQIRQAGKSADLCLEGIGRDSCPAIIFACLKALERQEEPTLLVLPSDHLIDPVEVFDEQVEHASAVSSSHLVTFGFKAEKPHTGYGYIKKGAGLPNDSGVCLYKVKRFVEKPDQKRAESYHSQGYLWNGGIFLINARLFLSEVRRFQPDMLEKIRLGIETDRANEAVHELPSDIMSTLQSISVDHAVFEKSDKVAVCASNVKWLDIGNWDSAASLFPPDKSNNSVSGKAEFRASKDNFVHSPHHRTCLIGVENLAVVVTHNSVLVTHRTHSEEARNLAEGFHEPEMEVKMFPEVDHRPWGEFHRIDLGEGYQVKRLRVEPGQILSLQSHEHRSEHWIVVSGAAEVTIGDLVKTCHVDESVYIPRGSVHRLANKGTEPLILIEVQTGSYLGEDDIVRIEDVYDRVKK